MGTGLEYGESLNELCTSNSKLQPIDSYAKSKVKAYYEIYNLAKEKNINVSYIRPFQIFGPGENIDRLGGALHNLININGTINLISPYRKVDFLHVCDLVDMLLMSREHLDGFQVHNFCSGEPIEIIEFATYYLESHRLRAEDKLRALPWESNGKPDSDFDSLGAPSALINSMLERVNPRNFEPEIWRRSLSRCIRNHM